MLKTRDMRSAALAAGALALTLPAAADYHSKRGYDGYGGRGHGEGIVLHADADFSGESIRLNGAEPDLSRFRFNDRVSSISLRSGAWEVCTDANFRGRCEVIDGNVARLNEYRLNDNISSVRPVSRRGDWRGHPGDREDWQGGRGARGGLVLFADSELRGPSIEIGEDVSDLNAYRFNDKASSFLVTRGTWQVCEHANYRGRCEIISGGEGDLKPIRMNDNISSVRRFHGRW
ncbi:beta/gamma crystallin-related protein [Hyphomonas pacifica]|uniref:Uncharacterized protein n=1 Tax=Hyphomonas pacifica TaxID=1280941 RepID=A0A062TT83_9PROT|nr:beta/gamma crystallin-related protein [Hyphomonas pacifica]KCZ46185.1 hypothetical protein HY2_05755 [Hyphomonas pacifica]RAN31538.1 hypothetical protein HY11_07165 [Hyphomonas pacifica]RAN35787.1 hypothetical protein HY3_06730 [Hyphomonas pacifica]